jgi:hypothetical protein
MIVVSTTGSCAGGDKPERAEPTKVPTFAVPSRSPLPSANDATRTPFTLVRSALLESADLPGRWSRGNFSLTGDNHLCGRPTDAYRPEFVVAQDVASFARGTGARGVTIAHIAILMTTGQAQRSLSIVREDLAECEQWTEPPQLGGATWNRLQYETGDIGDESVYLRAESEVQSTRVRFTALMIRRNDLVSLLFIFSSVSSELPDDEVFELGERIDRRMVNALAQ